MRKRSWRDKKKKKANSFGTQTLTFILWVKCRLPGSQQKGRSGDSALGQPNGSPTKQFQLFVYSPEDPRGVTWTLTEKVVSVLRPSVYTLSTPPIRPQGQVCTISLFKLFTDHQKVN